MKSLNPRQKGTARSVENKAERLKHAAKLSQSKTEREIRTKLGISKETLKTLH